MGYRVRVIEHTMAPCGRELITVESKHPRMIHSDSMTYRAMSRNASSSRSISVGRMNDWIREDPVKPVFWGARETAMKAKREIDKAMQAKAWDLISEHREQSLILAERLTEECNLHKQLPNRFVEPHAWINVLWTGNREAWTNVFAQRITGEWDAQPEYVAEVVRIARNIQRSKPRQLNEGEWHLPYITEKERSWMPSFQNLVTSVARCCRISYKTHEDKITTLTEDMKRHDSLDSDGHWSPFEHQGQATRDYHLRSGNFMGYIQYRQTLPINVRKEFDYELLDLYPEDWI